GTLVLSHEQDAGQGQRRARHVVVAGYHETASGRQARSRARSSLVCSLPDSMADSMADSIAAFAKMACSRVLARNCACFRARGRSINKRVKRETIQRVATPTAILVGLPDELAGTCTDVLGDGGLRVLRAGHVAAASERIPVVMPQLVV